MNDSPADSHDRARQSQATGDGIPTNPFASRYIRPGALPYHFQQGEDAATLIARLQALGWWGQITGPHGTGKSTLVAALLPKIERACRRPLLITLHDGERSLVAHRRRLARCDAVTLLVIDGYEQLSPWNRFWLRRACRQRKCGLLVTAHKPVGLPTLTKTAVDAALARNVLYELHPAATAEHEAVLSRSLLAHSSNLREALFDLYDLEELRRRR
ncbi:MAG TPA: hypothetical protein VGN12_13220 [Pirellulales bacterium]|jgi:hypothetical protein